MDDEKLKKGNQITKSFQGGSFEENMIMRRALWSNIVLLDDTGKFSAEEIALAEQYEADFLEYNAKVEAMK